MSMKNPNDTIGNRKCDLPTCSVAPQPTALQRAPTEMSTRSISCEVKATGAQGWQRYHLHVPIVLKSGSLNILEPSGPVQACNGIALLSRTGIIPNKLHECLKLLNLHHVLYIPMHKAIILCTCRTVNKFLAEQWIGSAWSVRPVLFWESSGLLWSEECFDDNNNIY